MVLMMIFMMMLMMIVMIVMLMMMMMMMMIQWTHYGQLWHASNLQQGKNFNKGKVQKKHMKWNMFQLQIESMGALCFCQNLH